MQTSRFIVFAGIFFLIFSCRKDDEEQPAPVVENGVVRMNISHVIDGKKIVFDTMLFKNAVGTSYCITKLHYYISSVQLIKNNGEQYVNDSIFYISAAANDLHLLISKIPSGDYTQLSFCIGIKAEYNQSAKLPSTWEHLNMAWPDDIGGGYHFLKLEGYYQDSLGKKKGYAVHLGTNPMLVKHIPVYSHLVVTKNQTATINLEMNVNEWFKNPNEYDFAKDGNYTMSDPVLMKLISDNGKDVFTLH